MTRSSASELRVTIVCMSSLPTPCHVLLCFTRLASSHRLLLRSAHHPQHRSFLGYHYLAPPNRQSGTWHGPIPSIGLTCTMVPKTWLAYSGHYAHI